MIHAQSTYRQNRGFTLVELSIVLVIIGLIVAAVVGGRSLLHTTQLNTVVKDVTTIRATIDLFREKYHALPGDFSQATSFWGTAGWPDDGTGVFNGDGDGLYSDMNGGGEGFEAFRHMARAGMIPGDYKWPDAQIIPGENVYKSRIDGLALSMFWTNSFSFTDFRNVILLWKARNLPPDYPGALIAADAYFIDLKLDDGDANGGQVYGIGAADTWGDPSPGCMEPIPEGGTGNYLLDDTTNKCMMTFNIDFQVNK